MFKVRLVLSIAALVAALTYPKPAPAQTIIDEWQNIKPPAPPELKTVTLESKTTALFVMDVIKQLCNEQNRPRCLSSIPRIAKLLAAARSNGVMVVYTIVPSAGPNAPTPVIGDTIPEIAPKGDEPVVTSTVDKFILRNQDTGLEKMLKDRGITSVITVGTAVHGAVLYTASAAARRGFDVIVPIDGISGIGQVVYDEQAVAFILTHAPVVSPKITLTSIDMIKFK
jgi:nicotinamidase-related amidase